jgi:hypothetical protein
LVNDFSGLSLQRVFFFFTKLILSKYFEQSPGINSEGQFYEFDRGCLLAFRMAENGFDKFCHYIFPIMENNMIPS